MLKPRGFQWRGVLSRSGFQDDSFRFSAVPVRTAVSAGGDFSLQHLPCLCQKASCTEIWFAERRRALPHSRKTVTLINRKEGHLGSSAPTAGRPEPAPPTRRPSPARRFQIRGPSPPPGRIRRDPGRPCAPRRPDLPLGCGAP